MRVSPLVVLTLTSVLACGNRESRDEAPNPPAEAAPAEPESAFERFPSTAAAVTAVLGRPRARAPRVIGFGEYHQSQGGPPVATSLYRFRELVLPVVANRTTDLIVETWVEDPSCAKPAKQVAAAVGKQINRPVETSSEILDLLRAAMAGGIDRHLLTVSCEDFAALRAGKEVDYPKLLSIITERLLGTAKDVLARRAAAAAAAADPGSVDGFVILYGGSMHNDVDPVEGLERFSYAERMSELTGGRFLEVDLFVPELIADSSLFASKPWFEIARREAANDSVLVFERSPVSYVIILRSGLASDAEASAKPEPVR